MAEAPRSNPDLSALRPDELMSLFATLEAPPIGELNGEYRPQMLRQISTLAVVWWTSCLRNPIFPGIWIGKAFRPVSDTEGRGYNKFRHFGRTVERFPMKTIIAPSRYDGRPAYQLVYRAYHSLCGTFHMVDEVRRLRPGAYLLIGTWGFTDHQRRDPSPFLLTGPIAPYDKDVGVERAGFSPASEIPALRDTAV
jgi:hypothetical protein